MTAVQTPMNGLKQVPTQAEQFPSLTPSSGTAAASSSRLAGP